MATTKPTLDQAETNPRAAVLDQLRAEAADEANRSGPLIAAVDAIRAAVAALVESVADHNARVSRWHTTARNADAPDRTTPRNVEAPASVVFGQDGAVVIDGREFRPLDAATLVDVIVHQAIRPGEAWSPAGDLVHGWDVPARVRAAAGD
ncbi:hypothetical protein amrb99_62110 [Actinomadura sp. RB99]|uniref:hypothetical protein n=1 Tax=Actinomadura sp. RB99 TaxID=2691577 RepID=UPI001682E2BD|nr:hypothetical protein [Actinomadura sp. RB99]MBD2897252.1 hypothetical protein [Actinomadura sp. RB99]